MKQTEVLFSFQVAHENDVDLDRLLERLMDSLAMTTENKVECVYGPTNKSKVVLYVAPITVERGLSMVELMQGLIDEKSRW